MCPEGEKGLVGFYCGGLIVFSGEDAGQLELGHGECIGRRFNLRMGEQVTKFGFRLGKLVGLEISLAAEIETVGALAVEGAAGFHISQGLRGLVRDEIEVAAEQRSVTEIPEG